MAGLKRSSVYDSNQCMFTGRVYSTPTLSQFNTKNGKQVDCLKFTLVMNSNPYKPREKDFIDCIAWGAKAAKIHALGLTPPRDDVRIGCKYHSVPIFVENQPDFEHKRAEFEIEWLDLRRRGHNPDEEESEEKEESEE